MNVRAAILVAVRGERRDHERLGTLWYAWADKTLRAERAMVDFIASRGGTVTTLQLAGLYKELPWLAESVGNLRVFCETSSSLVYTSRSPGARATVAVGVSQERPEATRLGPLPSGSRAVAAAVLSGIYARAYPSVSYHDYAVSCERAKKRSLHYAPVEKTGVGQAPVPKNVWRGACAAKQRALLRLFRGLGSGPRLRSRRQRRKLQQTSGAVREDDATAGKDAWEEEAEAGAAEEGTPSVSISCEGRRWPKPSLAGHVWKGSGGDSARESPSTHRRWEGTLHPVTLQNRVESGCFYHAVRQSTGESEEIMRSSMSAVARCVLSPSDYEACNLHDPAAPTVPPDVAAACVVLAPQHPLGIVVVEVPSDGRPGEAWHFAPLRQPRTVSLLETWRETCPPTAAMYLALLQAGVDDPGHFELVVEVRSPAMTLSVEERESKAARSCSSGSQSQGRVAVALEAPSPTVDPHERCPDTSPEVLQVRCYRAAGGLSDREGSGAHRVWAGCGVRADVTAMPDADTEVPDDLEEVLPFEGVTGHTQEWEEIGRLEQEAALGAMEPLTGHEASGSCGNTFGRTCGIRNLGLTCYLNCALQLMFNSCHLAALLADMQVSQVDGSTEEGAVVLLLQRLFRLVRGRAEADRIDEAVVALLGLLGLPIGTEHDATEVLERLYECILRQALWHERKVAFTLRQTTHLQSLQACQCVANRGVHVKSTTDYTAVFSSRLDEAASAGCVDLDDLKMALEARSEEVVLERRCEDCGVFLMQWRRDHGGAVIGREFIWRLNRDHVAQRSRCILRPCVNICGRRFRITGVGEYIGRHYIAYIYQNRRWLKYDDSSQEILRCMPDRLETTACTLLMQEADAEHMRLCSAEAWRECVSAAKRFRMIGWQPDPHWIEARLPKMQQALPYYDAESCVAVLTTLHSYCLSDFAWHNAVFERRLDKVTLLAAAARKRRDVDDMLAREVVEAKELYELMEENAARLLATFWRESCFVEGPALYFRGLRLSSVEEARQMAQVRVCEVQGYPVSASTSLGQALQFATPGMKMSTWEMRAAAAGHVPHKTLGCLVIYHNQLPRHPCV